MDTSTVWETLEEQPEELSDGELTDVNEERGCSEKDKDVSEEVMLAKTTLEELLGVSHDIKAKEKMLKANPNLGRKVKICQGIEKMLTPFCKLHDEEKTNCSNYPWYIFTKK